MKRNIFYIFLFLLLTAANCRKEGPNCHKTIKFYNNSSSTVIFSRLIPGADGLCRLGRTDVFPNDEYLFYAGNRSCIEEVFSNKDDYVQLFIVDTSKINSPLERYDCDIDTVFKYNLILKYVQWNIDSLQAHNFVLNYP